jgi:hypothetical protein
MSLEGMGPRNEVPQLPYQAKSEAEEAAVMLAYSVAGGRTRLDDLARHGGPETSQRIERLYKPAITDAGLMEVELLENFPVLTAVFGYTPAESSAGASTLRWFRSDAGRIAVHGYKVSS